MSDRLAPEIDFDAGTIPGTTGNADPGAAGVAGSAGVAVGSGAGRYGYAPAAGGIGMGAIGAGLAAIWEQLHRPFSEYDAIDIALLVGVVMLAIILWSLILYHIRIAAEAI